MKTIEIGGVTFELIRPRKTVYVNKRPSMPFCSDIFDWYGKPSQYKVEIWNSWVDWAYSVEGIIRLKICSANCNTFSIEGLYRDCYGTKYLLRITKYHNRAYVIG